jgi:hypothetical protein
MTRDEIRRRALHAAAAVSFTVGLVACGSTVLVETGPADDGAGGTAGAPSASATATTTDPVDVPDAAVADAGDVCPHDANYGACCDQHNWDPAAGCLAWGPPMPPAMGVA